MGIGMTDGSHASRWEVQPLAPDGRASWERQPGESAKAYYAFTQYREMPPHKRSLRVLGRQMGYRKETALGRWSVEWQ